MKEPALYPIPSEPALCIPRDMAIWSVLELDKKAKAATALADQASIVNTLNVTHAGRFSPFMVLTLSQKDSASASRGVSDKRFS